MCHAFQLLLHLSGISLNIEQVYRSLWKGVIATAVLYQNSAQVLERSANGLNLRRSFIRFSYCSVRILFLLW